MRKTNRTKKTTRTARKTTTRKTTRKAGTSKTITAIAKQFISGMKTGKGFTTVINGICKKTGKNYNTICQTLCKSGLCCCCTINGTKIWWPNFTSKASKTTCNTAQAACCQAMVEWCLATGCCTPRQLQNNSKTATTLMTFCCNCCMKAMTGKTFGTNANTNTGGAWMTNWSKSNNRTWKSGKTFKFPTFATRTTGKRTRKAA